MTDKMPDWEVVLRVLNPVNKRPRRMSMHTLAACTGRDIDELIKEVKESKKVVGYKCPDVGNACIFYLKELRSHPGMIDSADKKNPSRVWEQLAKFLIEKPYPKYKGFARFVSGGAWSGGSYGKGTYVPADCGMPHPFDKEDYPYGRLVIKALTDAGYTPGFTIPEVINEPVKGCTSGCKHS